jgi:hypothetical protein
MNAPGPSTRGVTAQGEVSHARARRSSRLTNPYRAWPAICLQCGGDIDLDELRVQRAQGRDVRHMCGRLLIRGEARHE